MEDKTISFSALNLTFAWHSKVAIHFKAWIVSEFVFALKCLHFFGSEVTSWQNSYIFAICNCLMKVFLIPFAPRNIFAPKLPEHSYRVLVGRTEKDLSPFKFAILPDTVGTRSCITMFSKPIPMYLPILCYVLSSHV